MFAIIAVVALIAGKEKSKKGELTVTNISDQFDDVQHTLNQYLLTDKELKQQEKDAKKKHKQEQKNKDDIDEKPRLFVLDFKGSKDAEEVESLREEISALLSVATDKDEVFVKLESPGGFVHSYGLAASQLDRIRQRNIPLTVSVDRVAASGGYMMACVADKIISAPFAIIGSIGVIAQVPNFNKILKKNDIDFEQLTAGEYKRTLSVFGENTDKGRAKFIEELEDTHTLFKEFVHDHRKDLDITKVATGETWYGSKAKDVGLVDDIITSDDYLQEQNKVKCLLSIKYEQKKGLAEKFAFAASLSADKILTKVMNKTRVFAE